MQTNPRRGGILERALSTWMPLGILLKRAPGAEDIKRTRSGISLVFRAGRGCWIGRALEVMGVGGVWILEEAWADFIILEQVVNE